MAIKNFVNYAFAGYSIDYFSIGEAISYDDINDASKDAICSNVKSFLLCSKEKARLILENTIFEIVESNWKEEYPFAVSFFVEYDSEEINKIKHMKDSERAKLYLKDYNVNADTMDFITNEVCIFNKKLSNIMERLSDNRGRDVTWRDLNSAIVENILEIYNSAVVDIKTGKIKSL